ncbi:hypothetical protein [Arthrobacter sp. B3I4]|uniref:hypothetical protein n=1 Tax=Arthrobacter sp. B3I4 TaxID=3042267 RepID=UPI00277D929E|nr:hypothetical protein [Arthrobacter sp. B3I4]MDQ0755744.1 hypothetical protein [Arthrobacter sp. B3I4]
MRWDALFADLEAQLAEAERRGLELEVDERARADAVDVELADRVRGSVGLLVRVHLGSGTVCEGSLSHAGSQWLVLDEARHQVLIPYAAATRYAGLSRQAVGAGTAVRQRLGLASALRGLARDRASLTVTVWRAAGGEAVLHGVIDRVGRDFFDLAVTAPGEERRGSNVTEVATIPFGALAALRSVRSAAG